MRKPKILLFCPAAPGRPMVYARALHSMLHLTWSGVLDYVIARQDEKPAEQAGYDNILEKYNRARDLALAGDYDALFTVENDMIIPPMALERLSRADADVAYGLYCSRHGRHQWLAYAWMNGENGESVERSRPWCEQVWGQVAETAGVGLGCTLIWRRVLENIRFRRDGPAANDWYFALDVRKAGYVQKHDFGVVCGHIDHSNTPRIIWPTLEDPERMYRYEFVD